MPELALVRELVIGESPAGEKYESAPISPGVACSSRVRNVNAGCMLPGAIRGGTRPEMAEMLLSAVVLRERRLVDEPLRLCE